MAAADPPMAPAMLKPTMSAPVPFRKSRRANSAVRGAFMALSSRFRGALDRAYDPHMRAAAAEIILQRVLDLMHARLGIFLQQGGGLHDHAIDAITALHRLFRDEGGLQFV